MPDLACHDTVPAACGLPGTLLFTLHCHIGCEWPCSESPLPRPVGTTHVHPHPPAGVETAFVKVLVGKNAHRTPQARHEEGGGG